MVEMKEGVIVATYCVTKISAPPIN